MDALKQTGASRFHLAAKEDGVTVLIPRHVPWWTLGLFVLMVAVMAWLCAFVVPLLHLGIFSTIILGTIFLFGMANFAWAILDGLYRYESYSISATTFSMLNYVPCCATRREDYVLATMGPMHIQTKTWTRPGRSGHTVTGSHQVLAFPYGTTVVEFLPSHMSESELVLFLRALTPYLPDHAKPQRVD
ncbi:Aste57867_857 [Aphanomyces stellatus]|uniref:Aste57867_857 protein n=1 Tax=Aphanomyces stellatus TaxID=120398 RepID=A0A485K6Z1_9STRA|nr:hypothetical protein As57867_000856 [Aphanomyces stellatus]VFT78081.1 Aste57867_857 [Aphanomyces stellatus]